MRNESAEGASDFALWYTHAEPTMDRSKEWFEQAERDWDFGKSAASTWQYERADFIAQQSAEKAV